MRRLKNKVALARRMTKHKIIIILCLAATSLPALCGPNAARDFFQSRYNQFGVRNGKLITVDVYGVSADVVAEFDDGKFIVLWKKSPQGWKMWRESFNSNRSKK